MGPCTCTTRTALVEVPGLQLGDQAVVVHLVDLPVEVRQPRVLCDLQQKAPVGYAGGGGSGGGAAACIGTAGLGCRTAGLLCGRACGAVVLAAVKVLGRAV